MIHSTPLQEYLSKKIYISELDFLLEILPGFNGTPLTTPHKAWIAGGSLFKMVVEKPIADSDIDIFFNSTSAYIEFYDEFKKLNEELIVDTYKTRVNETFVIKTNMTEYKIQLVSSGSFETVEELLSGFDFTAIQLATDGETFYYGENTFNDLKTKTLKINKISYVVPSMMRAIKYLNRGMELNAQTVESIITFEGARMNASKRDDEIIGDYVE